MEFSAGIVNSFQLIAIFTKSSILDNWVDSEYVPDQRCKSKVISEIHGPDTYLIILAWSDIPIIIPGWLKRYRRRKSPRPFYFAASIIMT